LSFELLEKKFCCDLTKCFGNCCVDGDSGAPLEEQETHILEDEYQAIKPYLRPEGIEVIEREGEWTIDQEHDRVTPLVKGKECAYAIFDNGVAKCGIEKAYFEGKTTFRKPISCHLYPVRIKSYPEFDALNFDHWDICKPAIAYGKKLGLPAYEFVKDALIRKYGEQWYNDLLKAIKHLEKNKVQG